MPFRHIYSISTSIIGIIQVYLTLFTFCVIIFYDKCTPGTINGKHTADATGNGMSVEVEGTRLVGAGIRKRSCNAGYISQNSDRRRGA